MNLITLPHSIFYGENALIESKKIISELGKKALIITDYAISNLGYVSYIIDVLKENCQDFLVFDEINSEPTDEDVANAYEFYKKNGCDFIIALGGGSVIDTMKAVSLLLSSNLSSDMALKNPDVKRIISIVAIPTTCGTGSEATRFSVIKNTSKDVKLLLSNDSIIPDIAILDPIFLSNVPKKVIAYSGIDALCHAVEAYTSVKSNSFSNDFAVSAIKLIFKYLPIYYNDSTNKEAQINMSLAALKAGIAFNNSSVHIIHGMSRPIGALFHIPHGLSNAILLNKCLEYVLDDLSESLTALSYKVNDNNCFSSNREAAEYFINKLKDICRICEIPDLKEVNVDKNVFYNSIDKMTDDAIASGSIANTPKDIKREEIVEIYKSLY